MTAEKYMALHKVTDMVLLCEDCAPVGSLTNLESDARRRPLNHPGLDRPASPDNYDAPTSASQRRPRGLAALIRLTRTPGWRN